MKKTNFPQQKVRQAYMAKGAIELNGKIQGYT
jgi:hypothetical protein